MIPTATVTMPLAMIGAVRAPVTARPVSAVVSSATVTASFIARAVPSGAAPWATTVWAPTARSAGTVTGWLKSPSASVVTLASVVGVE